MKTRSQADQTHKGDRITLKDMHGVFEVAAEPGKPNEHGFLRLFLKPVPCGLQCSEDCDCTFSLLREHNGRPLSLYVSGKKRFEFHGNLAELEELKKQVDEKMQAFRREANGEENSKQVRNEQE